MTGLRDWVELDQASTLDLPIKGRVYRIPSPSGRIGLRVQAFTSEAARAVRAQQQGKPFEADAVVLNDVAELDFFRDLLSPAVYEEMLAHDVPLPAMKHAAGCVMAWIQFDLEHARALWEGKAPPARSLSAAGSSTPRPGSGSTTSTRTGKNRRKRAGGKSRGRKS